MPKKKGKNWKKKGPRQSRVSSSLREIGPPGPYMAWTREFLFTTIAISASGSFGAVNIDFAVLPGNAQGWLRRWDYMKIDWVEVKYRPRFNVNAGGSSNNAEIPSLVTVYNIDDNTTPTSYDTVLGILGSRSRLFDREVIQRVSPRVNLQSYAGGGGVLTPFPRATWINTTQACTAGSSLNVNCSKWATSVVTTAPGSGNFDIWVKLHLTLGQPAGD